MNLMDQLAELRACGGAARTRGLPDEVILRFAERDPRLARAISEARAAFRALRKEDPGFLELDENEQVRTIQAGFVNFYALDVVNPYVALAGAGPWIVTLKGAVLHDSGGYGMLGHGHAPDTVLNAMSGHQVMANVMTPNYSQMRLVRALRAEIGHRRGGCPYARFVCLNSGSEAVTVAARIADINARQMTDPGGRHANERIRSLSLQSGFHGRTERPARFSDASRKTYARYLASFRDRDNLITVAPNDIEQLEQVFAYAEDNDLFIEAFFMEPVMGEGNPGRAITPEFYARARELTREHGSVLLVDSIQAGLRAHGVLSITDFPGF
ncbi:MAG: aminotransferase class III-fold pyridoxal phosphate-dependent enzyme, partial [Xanthomonadales bacterium]|nr:aminotransferase class III-fold pyridoxal phosphate-dependent enzyme [Xanthomonadales bacterium]